MSTLQTKLTELQGEVAKQKTRENELLTQMEDIKHAKVRYLLNKDDQIEILLMDKRCFKRYFEWQEIILMFL